MAASETAAPLVQPRFPRRPLPLALTRTGWVFLAVTVFVYLATTSSGINLLYFAFGLLVGSLVISAFVASWSLRRLTFARDIGGHVIAGEPVDVVYAVSSDKRYWPTMGLRFREICGELSEAPCGFILHVPTGRSGLPITISTRLVARQRGLVKLEAIEISTTFPFGFLRRTRRVRVAGEVLVYPRIGVLDRHLALEYRESVESGAMTSNRRGGNDEFYGVREYRPGDNIRAIHWRSSARRGELMIREMAANAPPQLILVLNLRAWQRGGKAELEAAERAIELAATLVCYGFLENFAVGLAIAGLPGEAQRPSPHMGRDARERLLKQLALIDVRSIEAQGRIDFPNRIAGRAEWLVITLHGDDVTRDLLPPGGPAHPGGAGFGGHRTVLSVDAPDAARWVRYLTPEDTLRILRERDGGSRSDKERGRQGDKEQGSAADG